MDPVASAEEVLGRHTLLMPGDVIVVAVSGGPDSVGLLEILTKLARRRRWVLHVASFDHRWRPGSQVEGKFVARLADARGWHWTVGCAEPVELDEAGARRQRQTFLHNLAKELGAAVIATGHTADDRVETMLLNLLRGAGTTGLGALGPVSGWVIRPLIEVPRQVLHDWVEAHKLPFCEDPTNRDPAYLRNRVRHELLPALEEFSPGISGRLRRAVDVLGSEAEVLDELAGTDLQSIARRAQPTDFLDGLRAVVLELTGWDERSLGRNRLLVRMTLSVLRGDLLDVGLAEIDAVDALARGRSDSGVLDVGGGVALRSGKRLILLAEPYELEPWGPVPVAGDDGGDLPACGYALLVGATAAECPLQARVTAEVVERGVIRSRRRGDRLRPAGRGGSRSVADLMQELQIPKVVRDRVPLLVLDDQVVWLPGAPVDERFVGQVLVGLLGP